MSAYSFPCFMLKEGYSDKLPVQTTLPKIDEEGKIILEPEAVTKQELD